PDHRAPGVLHVLDRADRLGQLHQREDPLLHARAARRGDADERQAALGRALAGAAELLAYDTAHRAAHEAEVHDGELARHALDRSRANDHGGAETRGESEV